MAFLYSLQAKNNTSIRSTDPKRSPILDKFDDIQRFLKEEIKCIKCEGRIATHLHACQDFEVCYVCNRCADTCRHIAYNMDKDGMDIPDLAKWIKQNELAEDHIFDEAIADMIDGTRNHTMCVYDDCEETALTSWLCDEHVTAFNKLPSKTFPMGLPEVINVKRKEVKMEIIAESC